MTKITWQARAGGVATVDEQLARWFERISERTGRPVDALVVMALWEFAESFDWSYEDLKEGVIYGHSEGTA